MDCQTFSGELTRLIRPQSYPIGVKLLDDVGRLPEKAVRPSKYGLKISLCQWTTMARRWGRILGATAEDINCTPCLAALGLQRMTEATALGDYFMEMGYFHSIELARKAVEDLEALEPGQLAALCFFPLHMAPVEPDLVLIYGNPAQMSRLAAGYLYHYGEMIESRTTIGISCLSALSPYFSGKPAFVHPGRGERILAGTESGEMLLSLPAALCDTLADGLARTHEKGSRYPVQSYLLYKPPMLPPMKHLGEKLSEL